MGVPHWGWGCIKGIVGSKTKMIIYFREKCSKQNMNTFRENVFVCEDFYLNHKENELHRKHRFLGGLTENTTPTPILEIEQNLYFHLF